MIDRVKVDKYTVEIGQDKNNEFVSRVLRNNEPWIDKVYMIEGGNLITTIAYEIIELRDKLKRIEELYDIDKETLK